MKKDNIYKEPLANIAPFEFNHEVAAVFDDMVLRSVPFYREIIQRQADLIGRYYQPESRIYDLGCSSGNLGIALCETMTSPFNMIAVDSSKPMLSEFSKKLAGRSHSNRIELQCGDILWVDLHKASVIVLNLTLQFLPPDQRQPLLDKIYSALLPGGIFLFTEKVVHADSDMSDMQTHFYYEFKGDNGYGEMEISQKREALEDVLIPETFEAHSIRLQQIGFQKTDAWFKWFNFCSWICQK